MSGDTQYGGSVTPSVLALQSGISQEALHLPSSLKLRAFQQQFQPTVANSMGMHSLPPVSVRTPISDQYAIGIKNPDLATSIPDPTVFSSVNGNVSPGNTSPGRSTPESRYEANANFRTGLQQQARLQARVQI